MLKFYYPKQRLWSKECPSIPFAKPSRMCSKSSFEYSCISMLSFLFGKKVQLKIWIIFYWKRLFKISSFRSNTIHASNFDRNLLPWNLAMPWNLAKQCKRFFGRLSVTTNVQCKLSKIILFCRRFSFPVALIPDRQKRLHCNASIGT